MRMCLDGLVTYPGTKDLKQKGILVRLRNGPKIENTLRISIGTKGDTDTLLQALSEIL